MTVAELIKQLQELPETYHKCQVIKRGIYGDYVETTGINIIVTASISLDKQKFPYTWHDVVIVR